MNTAVVDTDVASYFIKNHTAAERYLPDIEGRTLVLSFMTVAELERWVLEARWGEPRRARMREYLSAFLVYPYDRDLCLKWAEVMVAAKRAGKRIDCADAWVAATALLTGSPLITHNRRHYLGVPGLTLISHGE